MAQVFSLRLVIAAVMALLVVALAASASDVIDTATVGAQVQPTTTVSAVQLPPTLSGTDQPALDPAHPPATPMPATGSTAATEIVAAPENGGSLTASLGGSEVAVASVGGSYEVDAPKRRGKRGSRR